MLKKLFKHEFYSLFRNLLPIYVALGVFTITCKLTSLIEMDNIIYETVSGFSVMFYVVSILAMFIVGMVIIITRFYKNLLSHEGYLSFSLPFTATQHIVCKLICAVTMISVNFVAVLLSLLIVGLGTDALNEIIEAFKMMFNEMFAGQVAFRVTLFILQIVFMLILAAFQSILMFYAAMAIGQQFKSKIGGSVLAYIGLYVAMESIMTVCMIPLMLIFGENFENYLMNGGIGAVQVFLILPMAMYVVFSTVYFLITRHFLTKKLNLE